jgi:lysozyme
MKIFLLSFLFVGSAIAQNIYEHMSFTEKWEGRRNFAYTCPAGFRTIGVGHRMKSGENFRFLDNREINKIYLRDMTVAHIGARRIVKDFDLLPSGVKLIVVDLVFNLGESGFSKFKKTIAACEKRDWRTMAEELKNSRWYSQTGRRARNHVKTLRALPKNNQK